MSKQEMNAPGLNLEALLNALLVWLDAQNLEVQAAHSPEGICQLQCRERESWRTYVGMSTALNIELRYQSPRLTVIIGGGKWMDKGLVGTVGLFFPIAFVPAVLGAWKQKKLPERTLTKIQEFLIAYSSSQPSISGSQPPLSEHQAKSRVRTAGVRDEPMEPANSQSKVNTILCPRCRNQNVPQARFCTKCGKSLEEEFIQSPFARQRTARDDGPDQTDLPPRAPVPTPLRPDRVTETESTAGTSMTKACKVCSRSISANKRVCPHCGGET